MTNGDKDLDRYVWGSIIVFIPLLLIYGSIGAALAITAALWVFGGLAALTYGHLRPTPAAKPTDKTPPRR